MKFSVIIPIYNEENRIKNLLESVINFVDEIIVINKASTDNSKIIITERFGDLVRVIDVPYSNRGEDNYKLYCEFAKNDWVFFCVASEVVPKSFWQELNRKSEMIDFSKYDLVMVPRLYYCFGYNVRNSPWDVSFFPFFFNRKEINFTNKMHAHFSASDESRCYYLDCGRSNMIQHFTHTSVSAYIENTLGYASYESSMIDAGNVNESLENWIANIYEGYVKLKDTHGHGSVAHYAAWNIYWSIHILKLLETKGTSSVSDIINKVVITNEKVSPKIKLKMIFIVRLKIAYNKFFKTNVYFRKLRVFLLSKRGQ